MNYGLPDWMFAAFAIGGWELADLIARRWHVPQVRYVGGGIVVVCVIVILIRYVLRWVRRIRHPHEEDPNDWEQF